MIRNCIDFHSKRQTKLYFTQLPEIVNDLCREEKKRKKKQWTRSRIISVCVFIFESKNVRYACIIWRATTVNVLRRTKIPTSNDENGPNVSEIRETSARARRFIVRMAHAYFAYYYNTVVCWCLTFAIKRFPDMSCRVTSAFHRENRLRNNSPFVTTTFRRGHNNIAEVDQGTRLANHDAFSFFGLWLKKTNKISKIVSNKVSVHVHYPNFFTLRRFAFGPLLLPEKTIAEEKNWKKKTSLSNRYVSRHALRI